jgi:hypothetical protein
MATPGRRVVGGAVRFGRRTEFFKKKEDFFLNS